MNAYVALRAMWGMLVISLVLGMVFVFFVVRTISGISNEVSYRHKYGADWQQPFEQRFGSAEKFRTGTVAAGVGVIAMPSLGFWIYTLLRNNPRRSGKKKPRERHMSNTERVMQARSKALFWNYLGALGFVIGILLVLFRWGIFHDRQNEIILAMFAFAVGYCSIMGGCWWWLRAKVWSEALILIGVWPLPIAFIPFVRIIFVHILLTSPILLLMLLVLTPAILVVVIATLPDKSGVNRKQRRPMNWKDIGKNEARHRQP